MKRGHPVVETLIWVMLGSTVVGGLYLLHWLLIH